MMLGRGSGKVEITVVTAIVGILVVFAFSVTSYWNQQVLQSYQQLASNDGIQQRQQQRNLNYTISYDKVSLQAQHASEHEAIHHDTTILITSSFVPSHPSTLLIESVINSLDNLHGLPSSTPIIISIDGAFDDPQNQRDHHEDKIARLTQYVNTLRFMQRMAASSTPEDATATRQSNLAFKSQSIFHKYSNITIIYHHDRRLHLLGNVRYAMKHLVQTEFVYVLQHDIPFIHPINHTALVTTMEQYPKMVRLIRFSNTPTSKRPRDQLGLALCNTTKTATITTSQNDQIVDGPVEFSANGIQLTKTHIWSDRNHLTRKSYYEEMYDTIIDPIIANLSKTSSRAHGSAPPVIVRYMESIMEPIAETNCSYWGTYLYGYIGHPPTIQHLNGRKETNTSFFLFTAKDSNEPTKSFKK